MPSFAGSITTTGRSEAIRLDKALFRQHPEFRQKAKVRAQVIAPGHALISVVDDAAAPSQDHPAADDPVVVAFLAFLEQDLRAKPGRRTRLSKVSLRRAVRLTRNVKITSRETIPANVTF